MRNADGISGNKFLLDTNAVLYILDGDETLAGFLFEKDLYISVITELEVSGFKDISESDQISIDSFLKEMTIQNIDESIKRITIQLRKTTSLKLPDCIIAATAISLDIPFITSDKQFKSLADLNLLFYEK